MPITIQPIGIIRAHLSEQTWPYEPGLTAAEALKRLNLPTSLKAYVWLDGRRASPETILQDGQVVRIVSMLSGG